MDFFGGERIWRWLANFWTVVFLIFIVLNFFAEYKFGFLVAPFSAIYVGVLGLYAGTKEFDRWYEMHKNQHPGEVFVLIWTIVVLSMFVISVLTNRDYKMDREIVGVYIAVLSIFAITQKSKRLHAEKLKRR